MELSPEEKKRIYEEEKTRVEAQEEAKKEAKAKKTKQGCLGCLGLIVVIFIIALVGGLFKSGDKPSTPKTQEEIRKEQIEKQFSAWDGSHPGLTTLIKKTMNDPDSYKHVETVHWDKGDHLVVKTTFRGKNAFGGVVTNWVMAKVDLNGNVIEVLLQGP